MEKITVSDYLIQELYKLGITDVFGLPGDYNFNLVDSVENHPNVNWIGCTNELNAGYAADGYARVKNYGAVLTTFAVGELSAINAVAGSFAEGVPVIKIVGAPETKFIKGNILKHHNFKEPDYYAFVHAYSNVVEDAAFLSGNNPKEEIDRILSVFTKKKKPVYLAIPADICLLEIENESFVQEPCSNEFNLQEAVEYAFGLIQNAESPVILGDVLIKRCMAKESFQRFVKKTSIPVATLIMGKGLVNEEGANSKTFIGTYLGRFQNPDVYKKVNESDCVISVGTIFSDFNTLGYDMDFVPSDFILVLGDHVIIQNKRFDEVYMKDFLDVLTDRLEQKPLRKFEIIKNRPNLVSSEIVQEKKLDFEYILPRFEKFLKPNDMFFIDTGTLSFMAAMLTMPEGAVLYNQFLWASIGWATPALFGAAIADNKKRAILFTGEGSHQLTVQAISNIMFRKLNPIIIVLNNSGYTIERVLSKNPDDAYNDISSWQYTKLPEVFQGDAWTAQAKTNKEFDEALNHAQVEQQTKMCYIEAFTDKMDMPLLMSQYINHSKGNDFEI